MGPFSEKVNRNGGAIQLGKMPAKVIRSRLVQHVTWDELADRAQPVEVIALRFTSPTLFRAEQEHHTNISALNVFRHFQTRWQKYFGRSPHCPVANQPIVISRRDTIPSAVRFRDTTWTGFIGAVDFDIGLMPPEQRAALDACAGLAPFAGCGAYTTAGFGATDRATHDW
jgi:CRISPR/Cas system endoribonuclease Cas6 (RAMP superfamily)